MTVLDEFYQSYLHYSVSQRLFEDTCRQLRDCKGTLTERQALVDETLRLAMCVSDRIDDAESLIADTVEFIQESGFDDPDMLEILSLISNNLKEDRARANSYSNFITYRRLGNGDRRPRKPQIANPFMHLEEEPGGIEYEVIPPEEDISEDEEAPEEDVPEQSEEEEVEETGEPEEEHVREPPQNPLVAESNRIAEEIQKRVLSIEEEPPVKEGGE